MMMSRFGMFTLLGSALMGAMVYRAEADDGTGGGGGGGNVIVDDTGAAVDKGGKPVPPLPGVQPGVKPEPKDDASILDAAGFAPAEGDPGLNYAMKFLAGNGFNADNPAVAAAFEGDFSLLKAELAQKGIAGWEQALGLAEQSYGRHVKSQEERADAVGAIVSEFAEQQGVDWEQAVAHVAGSAKPEERTALNQLLADPATAHIAAGYITSAFINHGDTEIEPAARATGSNVTTPRVSGGEPLSRREYTAELGKLRQQLGDDSYMQSPQAQALYRRLQR